MCSRGPGRCAEPQCVLCLLRLLQRKPWNPVMRKWSFKQKFISDFGNIVAK